MAQPASNQPQQQNPMLNYYQEWSEKTPFVTRVSTLGIIGVYMLSFFIKADMYLGNETYFSIMSFEIYRLILSPFVGNSILTIIIILMTYPSLGMKMESSMGSAQFLAMICTLSIVTNMLFAVFCLILWVLGTAEALFWMCSGFWTIVFGLITIESLQVPDATRRIMFIPLEIPNKYFPLALYALFSLFSGPQLSYAIAILVGYLYSKGLLDRVKPSSYYLEELEAPGAVLHAVSRNRGWVLSGAALGHDAWIAVNSASVSGGGGNSGSAGSSGAGGSTGAGASRNVYGIGNDKAAPAEGNKKGAAGGGTIAQPPKDMFPGSGHKLPTSSGSSGGSYFGGTTAAAVSKEEMAARRLAALSGNNSNNV